MLPLLTLLSIPLAIYRVRSGDVKGHAGTMKGFFFGGPVVAGIFTLAPGCLLGNLLWRAASNLY